jgi:hypothetical protein
MWRKGAGDPTKDAGEFGWPMYGKFDTFKPGDPQRKLYKMCGALPRRAAAPRPPAHAPVRSVKDEGPLHQDTVFRTTDRLKLTDSIIKASMMVGGAELSKAAGHRRARARPPTRPPPL